MNQITNCMSKTRCMSTKNYLLPQKTPTSPHSVSLIMPVDKNFAAVSVNGYSVKCICGHRRFPVQDQNSVSNLIKFCPLMLGTLLLLAVKDMLALLPFPCPSLSMDLSYTINFMYSNHFITHSSRTMLTASSIQPINMLNSHRICINCQLKNSIFSRFTSNNFNTKH